MRCKLNSSDINKLNKNQMIETNNINLFCFIFIQPTTRLWSLCNNDFNEILIERFIEHLVVHSLFFDQFIWWTMRITHCRFATWTAVTYRYPSLASLARYGYFVPLDVLFMFTMFTVMQMEIDHFSCFFISVRIISLAFFFDFVENIPQVSIANVEIEKNCVRFWFRIKLFIWTNFFLSSCSFYLCNVWYFV